MALEGIWSVEVYGIYGWESNGVLVLDDGTAMGGGNHHFSVGRYRPTDDGVEIELQVSYHGGPRTLLGAQMESFGLRFDESPFIVLSGPDGATRAVLDLGERSEPALRLVDERGDTSVRIKG